MESPLRAHLPGHAGAPPTPEEVLTMIKRGQTGGLSHLLEVANHRIVSKCHVEGFNRQFGDFCVGHLWL